MKKLIIAISVLAALGASVTVLVGVALPTPAEFILVRAAKKTAELSSVHVAGTVVGNYSGDEMSLYMLVRGSLMPKARQLESGYPEALMTQTERMVFDADVDLRAFALMGVDIRGVIDAPKREPIVGGVRLASDKIFIRFTQVPLEGRAATPGFVGTWYDFLLNPPLTERSKERVPFFFAYTPEEERAWRDALAAARFLRPLGALGTGEVGGRKAWVIPVRVDAEALVAWDRAQDAIFHVTPWPEAPAARELAARWHGDIAVDRATNQILAVTMTNTLPNVSPGPGTYTWRLAFSRHNEPLEVAAPERVESMEHFSPDAPPALAPSGIATGTSAGEGATTAPLRLASSTATSTISVANDDQDNDGLADVLEAFYGSDSHNPDSDGDGVTDGAEVDAGNDPIGPGLLYDFRPVPSRVEGGPASP